MCSAGFSTKTIRRYRVRKDSLHDNPVLGAVRGVGQRRKDFSKNQLLWSVFISVLIVISHTRARTILLSLGLVLGAFLVAEMVKKPSAMQETRV